MVCGNTRIESKRDTYTLPLHFYHSACITQFVPSSSAFFDFGQQCMVNIYVFFFTICPSRHPDTVLISLSSLRADPAYEAMYQARHHFRWHARLGGVGY